KFCIKCARVISHNIDWPVTGAFAPIGDGTNIAVRSCGSSSSTVRNLFCSERLRDAELSAENGREDGGPAFHSKHSQAVSGSEHARTTQHKRSDRHNCRKGLDQGLYGGMALDQ